jgi:hypothetical protein
MELQLNNSAVSKTQKSGLAKLLATENISVRHENIPTAYFNIKTRVLGLPNWDNASADIYDLLVGHEVGHALFTPSIDLPEVCASIDADNVDAVKSFINVIEDVRIEKKIKRKFAGLRKNFYKGYEELVERDFFGTSERSIDDYTFIDRINLFFKGNGAFDVPFTDEEKSIVNEVASSETFEEVVDLAKRIYNDYSDDVDKDAISDQGLGEESDDGEYGDDNITSDGAGQSNHENSDDDEDSTSGSDDDNSDDVDSNDDSETFGKGHPNKPNESETQKSFDDASVEHLTDENASEPFYGSIPSVNAEPFIIERALISQWLDGNRDYLQTETLLESYSKFKTDSKRTVNYLAKEFELKKNAQQHARSSVAKTGVLNVDKLHTYKFSDDLFKRVTVVPDGKNHGLVLFVDWSSSIIGSTLPIAKQVLNLAWFCKKVNIPFEVYAFTDGVNISNDERDYVGACKYDDGDITVSKVHLLNFLSSRIKTNAFNQACLDYYTVAYQADNGGYWSLPDNLTLSSTPLNDSILLAHDIIPKFKASNNLEVVNAIFLTDGASNGLDYVVDRSQPSGIKGFRAGSYYGFGSTERSYITDTKTKINYNIEKRSDVTNILLRSLHDRLGINVIGFFVTAGGNGKNAIIDNCLGGRWGYDHNELKRLSKEFNRDGSLVVEDHEGYNEFYLIKGGKALDTESDLEVADDASKRVLTTAFKKHSKSKTVNKVILSRFIKLIA